MWSQLGDWAARIALALLVLERTGNPALTGIVIAVTILPWVGLGQFVATLGDQHNRRTVLWVCDLARAGLFALIALVDLPLPVIFVFAFAAGSFDPPFSAARAAMVPNVVGHDQYPAAISLTALTEQAALLAGYAAGGGLVALFGAQGALGVNAATFALSAFVVVHIPWRAGKPRVGEQRRRFDVAGAMAVVLNDRFILHALLALRGHRCLRVCY